MINVSVIVRCNEFILCTSLWKYYPGNRTKIKSRVETNRSSQHWFQADHFFCSCLIMPLLNIQVEHFSALKLNVQSLALPNHLHRFAMLQMNIRCGAGIAVLSCHAEQAEFFVWAMVLCFITLGEGHLKSWEVLQRQKVKVEGLELWQEQYWLSDPQYQAVTHKNYIEIRSCF